VNKTYADSLTGVSTLQGVLTAGNSATGTMATITLIDTDVGNIANPILSLQNSNATGSVALECYKNKPTAVVNGDVLFTQSVFGKDSALNKQEYTRINHTIRDGTAGVEDGSIEFGCFVNGAVNTFLQINGNENEVNILRPLDMTGNAIRTTTGNIPINATASSGTGHIDITSKTGSVINVDANININASASTGTGIINLIPKVSTGAILTDSKIATLNGFPSNVGSSIDFGGANPDNRFALDENGLLFNQLFSAPVDKTNIIDIKNDANTGDNYINQIQTDNLTGTGVTTQNICNLTLQKLILTDSRATSTKSVTIDNNTSSSENRMDFIQNSGGGVVAQSVIVNTAGTQMLSLSHTDNAVGKALSLRQDTGGTGKLQYDNTIDSSAFEISSNNTDLTLTANGGAGNCKVSASTLQFNNVNIIPRRLYNTFAFSVSGSPSTTILNFGPLADMVGNTTWKVDVAFYTGDGNNPRNILTYVVQDNTPQYVEQNSVFGYTQGGLQTAIRYDPTSTPMGTYCSFTDTFEVGGLASGACSFILTGGTSDSSTWSGTCRVSIVLTRLS
jgi:hypothetical protein